MMAHYATKILSNLKYIFRPGIYNNASVCVGSKKSTCPNELLWPSNVPSSIPAMGFTWIFIITWKFSISRFVGNGRRSYILLLRRRFPKSTRWEKTTKNTYNVTGNI